MTIIAALDRNGAIGKGGEIPWRSPADMAHFARTTMGHAIIMGRKTFESIGRPLPGRQNIVMTRGPLSGEQVRQEVTWASRLKTAIFCVAHGGTAREVFIIGGAQIYREALSFADRMILTYLPGVIIDDADTFFPKIPEAEWGKTHTEFLVPGEPGADDHFLIFQTYERIAASGERDEQQHQGHATKGTVRTPQAAKC